MRITPTRSAIANGEVNSYGKNDSSKLSSTTKSNAEKKLFQMFTKDLSDDCIVFHGAW
jgi:glutamate synthase domain-containing protein 1